MKNSKTCFEMCCYSILWVLCCFGCFFGLLENIVRCVKSCCLRCFGLQSKTERSAKKVGRRVKAEKKKFLEEMQEYLASTLAGEGDQLLTDQKDDDQDDSKLDEDDDD